MLVVFEMHFCQMLICFYKEHTRTFITSKSVSETNPGNNWQNLVSGQIFETAISRTGA